MIVLLGLVAIILVAQQILRSPSYIGARGEQRVITALRSVLGDQDYQLFNDLTLPAQGGTTQIDHVVVSRFGVFVVETKNLKGWIFGGSNQARWTQVVHRHKSQFQNPIRQNYKHVKAIQELLGIEPKHIHNLVAFVGSAVPKTTMPSGVFWNARMLAAHIKSHGQIVFDDGEVSRIAENLSKDGLKADRQAQRAHVRQVRSNAAKPRPKSSNCPRCGAKMVERTNNRTGDSFQGCSRFPKCRGTRRAA